MKDASKYEKKLRKLLADRKDLPSPTPPGSSDAAVTLLESILQANAGKKRAVKALAALREEFIDFNELRVSPVKDIVDCIGKDYPQARQKAQMITAALSNMFQRTNTISMDYMAAMSKRDLRQHLHELGLDGYSADRVVLCAFDGHAVPVDEDLADVLKLGGYVHPDADLDDVRGFLRRVISYKNAFSAHEFFHAHVTRNAKALARKRKTQAVARAKAEAKAQAEAKAKAEAEAKAQAEAEAKAEAKVQAEAKAQAEAKRQAKAAKAAIAAKARKAAKKPTKKKADAGEAGKAAPEGKAPSGARRAAGKA